MHPATDLADCSAIELLQLYRSRLASPVEATRAVLARIDQHNPTLNAFCHLAPEEALLSAQASEARQRVPLESLARDSSQFQTTRGSALGTNSTPTPSR